MNPFPKCISKNCEHELICARKLNGDESKLVDYIKVDMGIDDRCVWLIENKEEIENGE